MTTTMPKPIATPVFTQARSSGSLSAGTTSGWTADRPRPRPEPRGSSARRRADTQHRQLQGEAACRARRMEQSVSVERQVREATRTSGMYQMRQTGANASTARAAPWPATAKSAPAGASRAPGRRTAPRPRHGSGRAGAGRRPPAIQSGSLRGSQSGLILRLAARRPGPRTQSSSRRRRSAHVRDRRASLQESCTDTPRRAALMMAMTTVTTNAAASPSLSAST